METGDGKGIVQLFDALRKHYPVRREIEGLAVHIQGESPALGQLVKALGGVLV